eukprot:8383777-Pyramimonas_sp.AAC.1
MAILATVIIVSASGRDTQNLKSKKIAPRPLFDNSCKVIRYTEEDMRTDEGLKIALNDIVAFKGNILRCGAPCRAHEAPLG